jgi:hypothetical protein
MDKRLALAIAALGVVLVVVSALADPIGIGGDEEKFGWKQWTGIGIGVVLLVTGALLARRPPTPTAPGSEGGGEQPGGP